MDEWNKQLDYLTANGIVGENEISILEDYCLLFQRIREDISMGRQISAGLLAQLRGYRADLGIGPSVRSKFKTDKPKQPANHWAGLANS